MTVYQRPTNREFFFELLLKLGRAGLHEMREHGFQLASSERAIIEKSGLITRVGVAKVNATGAQPFVYEITDAGKAWLAKRKENRAKLEDAKARGLKRIPRPAPKREEMDKRNERRRANAEARRQAKQAKAEKAAHEARQRIKPADKLTFRASAEVRITDETKITIIETPIGQRPVYVPPKRFMVSGRFA